MQDAARQYQAMEIQSMLPAHRLTFLCHFLLARLRRAKQALHDGDISERTVHMFKAQDSVIELLSALDREASAELVGRLASLYAYAQSELVQINAKPNLDRLDRLIGLVSTLHQAWEQTAHQLEADTQAEGAEHV